jgi:hypothetical protein
VVRGRQKALTKCFSNDSKSHTTAALLVAMFCMFLSLRTEEDNASAKSSSIITVVTTLLRTPIKSLVCIVELQNAYNKAASKSRCVALSIGGRAKQGERRLRV